MVSILQHAPGRINLSDYPEQPMPTASSEINLIEDLFRYESHRPDDSTMKI